MITLQELCQYLHTYLDVDEFEDYCPNGLQVEGGENVKYLGVAVSASLSTLEKGAELGVDALLVHHGLFWHRDPLPIIGVKKEKIALLLRENISLLGYHLPLDAHPVVGNNFGAAIDLGWSNLQSVGIGVKGEFPPLSAQEFNQKLEQYYNHPSNAVYGGVETVSSALLISGGAHREIGKAVEEGVDCFITGSFDEPIFHIAHEEGVNFFPMGHSNTETIGVQLLGKHLADKFSLKYVFIDVPNPF